MGIPPSNTFYNVITFIIYLGQIGKMAIFKELLTSYGYTSVLRVPVKKKMGKLCTNASFPRYYPYISKI